MFKSADAGLKELAPLKNLTSLNLTSTPVTDAGLRTLAPLKELTILLLAETSITGVGLKDVAQPNHAWVSVSFVSGSLYQAAKDRCQNESHWLCSLRYNART